MTYTYTPQAGDVIESPSGRKRIRVMTFDNSYDVRILVYRRKWWFWGSWGRLFGRNLGWSHTIYWWSLENLVDDHGWKLIARRDQ